MRRICIFGLMAISMVGCHTTYPGGGVAPNEKTDAPGWVRPGDQAPTGRKGAVVYIESDPPGMRILAAKNKHGLYRLWDLVEGRPYTPGRAVVPIGSAFWLRVGLGAKQSEPQLVRIDTDLPRSLVFNMEEGQATIQKARVSITTDPPGATVMISDSEYGAYRAWPMRSASQITPINFELDLGQVVWIKLRKDGYKTSTPRLIDTTQGNVQIYHAFRELRGAAFGHPSLGIASALILNAALSATGRDPIVVNGLAPLEGDADASRQAAIDNAVSHALDEYLERKPKAAAGPGMEAKRLQLQTELTKYVDRMEVQEDGVEDGLYRVRVAFYFRETALDQLLEKNITFLVGGQEKLFEEIGRSLDSLQARRSIADALMDGAMAVTVNEDEIRSGIELARLAADNTNVKFQSDIVLHVDAQTELVDRFGGYKCESTLEYQLLIPVSPTEYRDDNMAQMVANGVVTASARDRRADAAARKSLRDAGKQVAEIAIEKMLDRFDRAAYHEVYIVGYINQRDKTHLIAELGGIEGVKQVRALFFSQGRSADADQDLHQFLLVLAPDARQRVAHEVARVIELPSSLEVVETDLYTTVAYVKVPREQQAQ